MKRFTHDASSAFPPTLRAAPRRDTLKAAFAIGFAALLSASHDFASAQNQAQEQVYPSKAIRWIVPFAPGSAADTTSRFLASRLSDRVKQPVVIENRPGAGAAVGVNALKVAAPDGYTIGNLVSANAAQPWLTKDVPFDIRNDFAPIALMYSGPMVMSVATGFQARDVGQFLALAKASPGKLTVGSIGIGSATHLAAELLKQSAGIDITIVPFKSAPDLHRAVAAGEITASFDTYASPKPLIDGGRLRVLAVTSADRMKMLPQSAAIGETIGGFDIESWTGVGAPKGTPAAILNALSSQLQAIMQSAEWQDLLVTNGVAAGLASPQAFGDRIRRDYEKFGQIARGAGLKPE
jgi:tripartite-type tricarboxylate transporter receptor subunit TctC